MQWTTIGRYENFNSPMGIGRLSDEVNGSNLNLFYWIKHLRESPGSVAINLK